MTATVSPVLGALPNVPYIFAKSNVAAQRASVNGAGDATSQALATITLPPNLLSGNTSIFVHALFRSTSSANAKTLNAKLGGSSFGSLSVTTNIANQIAEFIHADNASNKQKLANAANGAFHSAASTMIDQTKDCSVAIDLTLECNWAGATLSETIALESYMVIVYPGQ